MISLENPQTGGKYLLARDGQGSLALQNPAFPLGTSAHSLAWGTGQGLFTPAVISVIGVGTYNYRN